MLSFQNILNHKNYIFKGKLTSQELISHKKIPECQIRNII